MLGSSAGADRGSGRDGQEHGAARCRASAQDDGRQLVVTSTAALAAQRLGGELAADGVEASSYSTAALHAALQSEQLQLSPQTTVIHDEAALACTREQRQLLQAVESAGARLIEVGDPRQSRAVGAGGLWPALEAAARRDQAHVELTRNVRAQDPADRRDQLRFRKGQHAQALHGYAARGRLTIAADRRHAEDAALDAAESDRRAGKRRIVIAQSSNEHLDELGARAQAIRLQHGELGARSVAVPGRPYRLHPGDQVQIRRTLVHPEHGPIRNGTTGTVVGVDRDGELLALRLSGEEPVTLDRAQIDRAAIRLAYVQHPFPAQGQTTDTAHVIAAEHASAEGSYVALTRARERTSIYATCEPLDSSSPGTKRDQLHALAEQLGRSEPEVPSIHTPLAHEHAIAGEHQQAITPGTDQHAAGEHEIDRRENDRYRQSDVPVIAVLGAQPDRSGPNREAWDDAAAAIERYRTRYAIDDSSALGAEPPAGEFEQRHERRQTAEQVLGALDRLGRPVSRQGPLEERILGAPGLGRDKPARDRSIGWEP